MSEYAWSHTFSIIYHAKNTFRAISSTIIKLPLLHHPVHSLPTNSTENAGCLGLSLVFSVVSNVSILGSIFCVKAHSIHPSIFVRLSGAGLWGQLPEQGHPDFPMPGHFLQLFWEDPKAFPDQLRDTVTPVCPGSSSGSPPGGTCQEHLPREESWWQSSSLYL